MKKLQQIQAELKAPKNQRNDFGKYNYRSCEDILESVKPLLNKYECTLIITDEIKQLGEILFVESTVIISDGETEIKTTGQAGIDPNRKGMDIAQSFGSSSSYARKYALNGCFLIDDSKDADFTNTHEKTPLKEAETDQRKWLTESQFNATLKSTEVQAQKVLNSFKMKTEYKEKIINKFNLNK
tara:strand:+ start:2670 stop:3221 length:552 start_codon:yes stop_codon:yes gene_type:complete